MDIRQHDAPLLSSFIVESPIARDLWIGGVSGEFLGPGRIPSGIEFAGASPEQLVAVILGRHQHYGHGKQSRLFSLARPANGPITLCQRDRAADGISLRGASGCRTSETPRRPHPFLQELVSCFESASGPGVALSASPQPRQGLSDCPVTPAGAQRLRRRSGMTADNGTGGPRSER
jgi:hypothetical protein